MKAYYYLVNGNKYLDHYMIANRLNVSRHTVRGLLKDYSASDVQNLQNKKLYPLTGLIKFAKRQIELYAEKATNA